MTDDLSLKEYIALVEGNIRRDITTLHEHVREGQNSILKAVNRHEARISTLENWRWLITGGIGVLVFMVTTILLKFWK